MTIKLASSPATPLTFSASIKLSVPGAQAPAVVDIVFRQLGRKALRDWIARPKAALDAGAPISDAEFLDEVIVSWSGPVDENEQPKPYSLDALDRLVDQYLNAADEIYDGYLAALHEARAKNSPR